ncbi:hypothetical protein ACFPJ1_40600 [Kribbella qitaiheensis]|uniref:hypothetical protein n=1 Tax=Kribbella qitaiheensis TaxID=1544730 RepID=UPI003611E522
MTTTVTIGANAEIWDSLSMPDYEALLEWFRVNGIDPKEIRSDRRITIAAGVIDWWGINPVVTGSEVLETSWTSGDLPDVHLKSPVVEDMDAGLAERVHAVYVARVEKYAGIAAKVAGAHAAADAAEKVRKDAGLHREEWRP